MKRLSHILLALLLITSTSGVTISKHFCGNILRDVAIFIDFDQCCGDEDEMPMGCCHDEEDHYSVESEFQLENMLINQDLMPVLIAQLPNLIDLISIDDQFVTDADKFDPSPPPLFDDAIYMQIQSFLI